MVFFSLRIRDKPLHSKGVLTLERMLEGVTPDFVNLPFLLIKVYF